MLVSVPCFVASSVIATDNPYDIDADKARAMAEEAAENHGHDFEAYSAIFTMQSLSENENGDGPICQPWPYCF